MDLIESLRIFVAIAEENSLSSVARARGVAASTITLTLKRLEEHANTSLVTRTTRQLSLTPEGDRFLEDARRILADIDDAFEKLVNDGPLTGDIHVTSTNDFGRRRVAPIVEDFMRHHPNVRVHLMLTDAVVDLVQEGFDLGIRTGPLQDSRLVARPLMRGGRRICASPIYWDNAGRPQHPRDLTGHNCMVLARPGAPQNAWRFNENGRDFTIKVNGDRTANDGETLRRWAISGAGVVLKADWDIADDLSRGRLESVLDAFIDAGTNLYAVYPSGRTLSRRLMIFLDYLSSSLD